MAARLIPTTDAAVARHADTEGTDGEVAVAAPGAGDTAAPGAEAALGPEADPATAGRGPDPDLTPDPAAAPRAAHHAEASPNHLPGPVLGPSQSLTPGVAVLGQTGGLNRGPDPGAGPSLRRATKLHRNHELKSR